MQNQTIESLKEQKRNYPAKWKLAQQMAQSHNKPAEQLFVELGGGCVESYQNYQEPRQPKKPFTIHSVIVSA
jgi:hypothetical protein